MTARYTVISILMILLVFSGGSQTNLTDYLIKAAENNPGLKAKFSEYNASLEKINQVGSLPDPNLSFAYFIQPIETRVGPQRAKLSLNQMFPWFGTIGAYENVYIEKAKAKYEIFEEAKSYLYFDLKSIYYHLYYVQKSILSTQDNINILKTLQQLAIIKIETGEASIIDEMRVEMEMNELNNQQAYLEDYKQLLLTKFKNILNEKQESEILIPDTIISNDLIISGNNLLDSIHLNNHSIQQLNYNITTKEKESIHAKKRSQPQFSLGLDYVMIDESSNPNLGEMNGQDALILPKFGISLPLYRKKYSAMIQEASINMETAQLEKENRENQLTNLYSKGINELEDSKRRIVLYKRQLQLANKTLSILLTSYSTDGKNFEEVLRIEKKVLKYQLELHKAYADKNAAIAFIDYLSGK